MSDTLRLRLVPYVLILLALPATTARMSAQGSDGILIERSDARELVLSIAPEARFAQHPGGDLLPKISGAIVANLESPGAPMRLEIRIPVALPAPSGSSIEVLSLEYDQPRKGRIAPVPALVRDASDMAIERYDVDAAQYAKAALASPAVELRYAGLARTVHAGVIAIEPVLVDPVAGTVSLLKRARVRLKFAAATPSARRPALEEIVRAAFINAGAAAGWTIDRSQAPLAKPSGASAARAWMRVEVREDGLQSITAEDFQKAGITLSTVDASRIAVYGGDGGDLPETPDTAIVDHLQQVPAIVERDGNGRATRVLFYGVGPNRWSYRGYDTIPTHRISPYVFANSYIIAVDGEATRGFDTRTAPASFDVEPAWGIARVFFEEEKVNAIDVRRVGGGSGQAWYGSEFMVDPGDRPTDTRPFMTSLPGLERTAPITYRIRVANAGKDVDDGGRISGAGTFRFWQQDTRIGEVTIAANGEYYRSIAAMRMYSFPDASAVPADGRSSLKIEFSNKAPASGFLDYYEIHYGRRLVADGGSITFDAPSGGGVARYRVTGFSSDDLLGFDITDPANPIQLERKPSGEFGVFVFHDDLRPVRQNHRYFVVERGAARRVANASKAIYGDLRSRPRDAQIIVVTHEDLKAAAQRYVDYRNSRNGLRAALVTTDEIYTEFSHGDLDPSAIRNYLQLAVRTWTVKPQYVILFGDATYDYRNIATRQKQLVPTYESFDGDSYNENSSSGYDDYMLRLDPDPVIDLISGRFPVETLEQANVMIDKIIRYESSSNRGPWRHTAIFAADDNLPELTGTGFVQQSESLSMYHMPGWMDARKIYLSTYPTVHFATDRKPGATADLLQYMDRGAVITNWIGHGNPKQWAHELLLERDDFIPRLSNDSALTYVTAATCNFGLFDDPSQFSGAEKFVLEPGTGAVAAMSAARASYIGPNEELITGYFDALFRRDPSSGYLPSIGAAFLALKVTGHGNDNDQKYHIFGDPSMRLNMPQALVSIDSINHVALDSTPAVVGALSIVTASGTVLDPATRLVDAQFNGTAVVTLFDANRIDSVNDDGVAEFISNPGGRLFRGPARVTAGRWTTTFRVPKDIAYDSAAARMHVYAYTDTRDAAGADRRLRVFGSDTVTVTDTTGPQIALFMDDRSFRSGDLVTPEPMLIVDLVDGSGLNASGSSLGHRIEAWIDNSPTSVDLTEYYQTSESDYRKGTAERLLLELKPGTHSVRVRAWDIFNNPAETTALFRISEESPKELEVTSVVNYPNPMSRETDFTFAHNQSRLLDVEIAIYTPAGRRVRTLASQGSGDRWVRVHWDGTDSDGAPVGNGVYLYRLRVKVAGDESAGSFETIDKVAVVR